MGERRSGIFACAVAVALGGLLASAGCGGRAPTGAARPATPTASASQSAEPAGRLPTSQQVCAAIREAGLKIDESEPEDGPEPGCRVQIGPDPFRHYRALVVRYEDAGSADLATQNFARRRENAFESGDFSGPPSVRLNLSAIGKATAGTGFDEGYYVFYSKVRIAAVTNGRGAAVLRRGQILVTLNLQGGDRKGKAVDTTVAIKNDVARKIIDQVADEALALIAPDPGR